MEIHSNPPIKTLDQFLTSPKHNIKKMQQQEEQKRKHLRPSDEIISRIKWDDSYDEKLLTIGYLDRFVGVLRCNLEEFEVGDIPYHRIVFLEYDNILVWDRESKLDLITSQKEEEKVEVPKVTKKQKKLKNKQKKQVNEAPKNAKIPEGFVDGDWISEDEEEIYYDKYQYKTSIEIE